MGSLSTANCNDICEAGSNLGGCSFDGMKTTMHCFMTSSNCPPLNAGLRTAVDDLGAKVVAVLRTKEETCEPCKVGLELSVLYIDAQYVKIQCSLFFDAYVKKIETALFLPSSCGLLLKPRPHCCYLSKEDLRD